MKNMMELHDIICEFMEDLNESNNHEYTDEEMEKEIDFVFDAIVNHDEKVINEMLDFLEDEEREIDKKEELKDELNKALKEIIY